MMWGKSGWNGQGQIDTETTALCLGTLHGHAAVVGEADGLDDGEANTGAASSRCGLVDAEKAVEDVRRRRGHAMPLSATSQIASRGGPDGQGDGPPRRVFDALSRRLTMTC